MIHPDFFEKMKDSDVFRTFFMSVTLEGLEEKYSITLSRGESCNERELLSGHFSFAIIKAIIIFYEMVLSSISASLLNYFGLWYL